MTEQQPTNLYVMTDADQIIEQLDAQVDQAAPAAEPSAPSLDAQLATIQTEASRNLDTAYNFNLIEDFCNFLDAEYPALSSVTDDVWGAASELAQTNNKLAQTVAAAAALAAEFRAQREDTLTKLAQLRAEIETCDVTNPSIAALAETLEEYQMEMFELGFSDYICEQLWHTSPLEYEEIGNLLYVLDELPPGNPLWVEFREWLERAMQESEEPTLS